jgi:hypothetical protein
VKDSQHNELMRVTETGDVGIGVSAPAATLDINGNLKIGTVIDMSGTTSASVLVLDNGIVKKRTLAEAIWDGDDGESYSAGGGININSSNVISAVDQSTSNETPQAGTAIAVSGRTVSVKVDNSSIKVNGSDQLYADVSLTESDPQWSANDNDHSSSNELQTLDISGHTITLSNNGGSVTVPDNVRDGDYSTSNETPQAGTATAVSGRTVNVRYDNSTIKVNGSNQLYADISLTESDPQWSANDNDHSSSNEIQNLQFSGGTLTITDGNSVILPDETKDGDYIIGNEHQDLGSSKSGESVTVTITDGSNTTFSIQDDDHVLGNEYQDLSDSRSGDNVTVAITNGSNTTFSVDDAQSIAETLADGENASGRDIIGLGQVSVGTTAKGAKIAIDGSNSYAHPNGATYKGGLYSQDLDLSSSDSHIAVEGVSEHYTSDNNTVRIGTHGTLVEWGDYDTIIGGGSLGYQNYGETPPWIAGVQGSVYNVYASFPSELRTAAGWFLNERSGSRDFGIYCDGQVRLRGGPTDMDGFIGLGANTNASIGRNTSLGRLYLTHTTGDIDLYANNIRFRGSVIHSSDRRFKTDITPLTAALDAVEKMQSVRYKWKDRPGDTHPHYGFIAQEMEKVLPEMVLTDNEGYKSIRYIELIPVLVNALQELSAENQAQQEQIETLKALIANQ